VFNRYVVFSANRDTIKNIFEWTQNDRWKSFWGTMTPKKGQAGLVGQVKPAIDRRDIEFLSPVEYAPPSHHHFDKLADSTGWRARASHIDEEELRCPVDVDGVEWDDAVPEELQIAVGDEEDSPAVDMRPVAAFAHECLEEADIGTWVHKTDVRTAFNEFARFTASSSGTSTSRVRRSSSPTGWRTTSEATRLTAKSGRASMPLSGWSSRVLARNTTGKPLP